MGAYISKIAYLPQIASTIRTVATTLREDPEIAEEFGKLFNIGSKLLSKAVSAFTSAAPKPAPLPGLTSEEIIAKQRHARDKLHMNIESDYNIAFCGQIKGGKSRMINALRNVKKGEATYATVDNVHSTVLIEPYKYPNGEFPHLVFWDCPGVGAVSVGGTVDSYFEDRMLYAFDCLLLFLREAVRKEDIEFAKQAIKHKVPFAFVRSRCDESLRERVEGGAELQDAKAGFLAANRPYFESQIGKGGAELAQAPLFFVSALVFEKSKEEFKLQEDELIQFVINSALPRRGVRLTEENNSASGAS